VTCATSQKGELIILNTKAITQFYNDYENMWWPCDKDYTIETVMTDCGVSTQDEINNSLILKKMDYVLYTEWLYQKWILSELVNGDLYYNEDQGRCDKVLLKIKKTFKKKDMIKFVENVNLGLIINERE